MLSKLLVCCLILGMLASLHAQTWIFKIEKVEVNTKKSNGDYWDVGHGAPDIRIVVYSKAASAVYKKEFETKVFKDVYKTDKIENTCNITFGKELKIEVWDNDVGRNDLIGSTFCNFTSANLVAGTASLPSFGCVAFFQYSLTKSTEDVAKEVEIARQNLELEQNRLQQEQESIEEQKKLLQMREEALILQASQWEQQRREWEQKEQEYQRKIQEMELEYQTQIADLTKTIEILQNFIAQQKTGKEQPTVIIPTAPTDTTNPPDVPDTPDTIDTPDVPDTPDTPDTPDVPDTIDTPDVPDTPDETFNYEKWEKEFGKPTSNPPTSPVAEPTTTTSLNDDEVIHIRQQIRTEVEHTIIDARHELYRELEKHHKVRKFLETYRNIVGE